ncbi:MAG: sensor histidine kinase [Salinigranum sp.]
MAELIHLLVADEENERLLAESLSGAYGVTGPDRGDPLPDSFDLCVVDEVAFGRHRDALAARKRAERPKFLPYLLVTSPRRGGSRGPGRGSTLAGLRDLDEFGDVDEVVRAPISKTELKTRIEGLLHTRRLSLELHREKERREEQFGSLFGGLPDPAFVLADDGTVSEANGVFRRVVAGDEDPHDRELPTLAAFPEESARGLDDVVERALAGENVPPVTVTYTSTAGETRYADVNLTPWSAAEFEGAIGVLRDVTRQEARKRELERQNERLEEFTATLTHDLRNPLGIAKGHLQLARETGDDDHFDTVSDSLERLNQLVDEALALAQQGRTVLDPEPSSLSAVAGDAWSQVAAPESTLRIEADCRVLTDRGRLQTLLENLFRNSVEHGATNHHSDAREDVHQTKSDEPTRTRGSGDAAERSSASPHSQAREDALECGSGEPAETSPSSGDDTGVSIRVGPLDDGTGFYVEDGGPGIPAGDRDLVFQSGYTSSERGTGFGLAIVRQIADAHGWDVAVTDGTDGGARFEVTGVDPA